MTPIKEHRLTKPRSVAQIFDHVGGVFAFVAGIVTILATLISFFTYSTAAKMDKEGIVAVAEVVSKRKDSGDDSDNYYVMLRYQHGDEVHRHEASVSSRAYDKAVSGQQYHLRYLPTAVHKVDFPIGRIYRNAVIAQVVALLFGVGGLVFLGGALSEAVSAVKARRYGTIEVAEVTGLHIFESDDEPSTHGLLVWRHPDGFIGRSFKHELTYLEQWEKGDLIHVYRGPRKSWWEGDIGPREDRSSNVPTVDRSRP